MASLDPTLYYIIDEPNGSSLRSCRGVVKQQLTGSPVQKFRRFTINGELFATTPLPDLPVWCLHPFTLHVSNVIQHMRRFQCFPDESFTLNVGKEQ